MHYLFSHKQTTSRWWPWLYTSPTSSFSQCNHLSFKLIVFLTVFPILGHQRIAGLSLGPSLWASRVLPCDWQKWGVTKAPGGLTTWTGNRATANVTRGETCLPTHFPGWSDSKRERKKTANQRSLQMTHFKGNSGWPCLLWSVDRYLSYVLSVLENYCPSPI